MTQPKAVPAAQRVNGVVPKPKAEFEVGVSAHLPFVTPYKNVWEALRDEEISVRKLVAMRKTDGQARALYRLITLPIRAALKTATFVPEEHVDGGEEEARWIEQMFTLPASGGGMLVPFSRVIAQMLMAIFDGFTAFEMVYWSPAKGPLKGKWTLKKLAHRPSNTLTFLLDDNSEFAGLRQQTMYQNRQIDVEIPAEHAIYYAANEEEKPFYGQSYFEAAWYHWDKKFKLYAIAHIAAQRAAVGTRVGKLPPGPSVEEKHAFTKALADLGVAQFMTIPNDYEVESLKEAVGFDFLSYINHHNSQMSKSILAAFFDDQQGSGGDASLVDFGRQSDSLFMMMLQTVMSEIEEVINTHVIPRFIDWNFDSQKYPKFQFGSLTEEQKAAMVDLFKTLSTAGQSLTISPEFVHELEKQTAEEFGLEVDYEAVEERMEAEAAMAQAQDEMMMQQQMMAADPAAGGAAPGAPGEAPGAAPAGGAGAAGGHPVVDPSLLPKGFTLSRIFDDLAPIDTDHLELSADAAELLAAAHLELTRGKARQGYKTVQTPAGEKIYGVPIGTRITRDMAQRTAAQGVAGKPYGGVRRDSATAGKPVGKDTGKGTATQTLGGGPGAPAQNPGGVVTEPDSAMKPKQTLGHPDQPGAQLLDYGDGTVAVRDANGHTSPRQRFQIEAFLKLGWEVTHGGDATAAKTPTKTAAKSTAKKTATKTASKAVSKATDKST